MATRRTTFSKTQRERDKRAKAAAKRERRVARAEEPTDAPAAQDENRVMAELTALNERYERGEISLDDFVARREELSARLIIP
jgi:hypothetical protein